MTMLSEVPPPKHARAYVIACVRAVEHDGDGGIQPPN